MNHTAENMPHMNAEEYFHYTAETDHATELLNGEIVSLANPSIQHQQIAFRMHAQIDRHIRGKDGKCTVLASVDVRLTDDTVVVPDVFIVCDPQKLDALRCTGAPDFVVEITSSNWQTDYRDKLMLYRTAGVREYWIVDTQKKTVLAYRFEENPNVVSLYDWSEQIPIGIYGGELCICIHDLL